MMSQPTRFSKVELTGETKVSTSNATSVSTADGALAGGTTPTKAEFDAIVNLANEIKADYNQAVILINDLKTKINAICKG